MSDCMTREECLERMSATSERINESYEKIGEAIKGLVQVKNDIKWIKWLIALTVAILGRAVFGVELSSIMGLM